MAKALDLVYTVAVVLVTVVGTAVTLWTTSAPDERERYRSLATATAVSLFVVALAATLLT